MSTTGTVADSGASYFLTARVERPVEGCDMYPIAFLQLKGGTMDNNTRAKLLDSVPYYYSYTWSRGPKKPMCCNETCPKGQSFDPVAWSKAMIGGPGLMCSVCERAGVPSFDASFCSANCFRSAWMVHSQKHLTFPAKKAVSSSLSGGETPITPVKGGEAVGSNEGPRSREPSIASADIEWTTLRSDSEKVYIPSHLDVGCCLRCEVRAHSTADDSVLAGPVAAYTEPVLAAPYCPPKRNLRPVPGALQGVSNPLKFRVVSYNILAELYATRQAYPYCDPWSLAWPYRKMIILAELEATQADVICLQEVQTDHYEEHIRPYMSDIGYDSAFKQKSREFMGQYGKVDGCATFWKRTTFIMNENVAIEFNDIARQEATRLGLDEQESRKFMNRLSRDNIAQVVHLETVMRARIGTATAPSGAQLCIVNTHLYSNQQRADVKLWQSMNLMWELQNALYSRDAALIICGDFNSTPDSAVYEYMVTGGLEGQPDAYPELQSDNNGFRILPSKLREIRHAVELSSCMGMSSGPTMEEPYFTNYTAKFKGTLDYVFYTPGRLRVTAVAEIPDEADIIHLAGDGLPCACYPSDHLMLCCDMALLASTDPAVTSIFTMTGDTGGSSSSNSRGHHFDNHTAGGVGGGGSSGNGGSRGGGNGNGSSFASALMTGGGNSGYGSRPPMGHNNNNSNFNNSSSNSLVGMVNAAGGGGSGKFGSSNSLSGMSRNSSFNK